MPRVSRRSDTMSDNFVICFLYGETNKLNEVVGPAVREIKSKGVEITVFSTCQENYDFIYNSLVEQAVNQEKERR
jgi:hypothetical protein